MNAQDRRMQFRSSLVVRNFQDTMTTHPLAAVRRLESSDKDGLVVATELTASLRKNDQNLRFELDLAGLLTCSCDHMVGDEMTARSPILLQSFYGALKKAGIGEGLEVRNVGANKGKGKCAIWKVVSW
jgi:hypothetical protein